MPKKSTDKEIKIAKAKQYLAELNASLAEIAAKSKEQMEIISKKHLAKKSRNIFHKFKKILSDFFHFKK